jgi:hypothetical protein
MFELSGAGDPSFGSQRHLVYVNLEEGW